MTDQQHNIYWQITVFMAARVIITKIARGPDLDGRRVGPGVVAGRQEAGVLLRRSAPRRVDADGRLRGRRRADGREAAGRHARQRALLRARGALRSREYQHCCSARLLPALRALGSKHDIPGRRQ